MDVTFAELAEEWLEGKRNGAKPVRPSTLVGYEHHLTENVLPVLGALRVAEITALHVEAVQDEMLAKGLKGSTVRQARSVVSGVMGKAMRAKLVAANPVTAAEVPDSERTVAPPPTYEECRQLIDESVGTPWWPAIVLAVATGARRSEVLALAWGDVDLDRGTVTIRRGLHQVGHELMFVEPKTARSRRTIRLPKYAVEALTAYRTEQREHLLRLGIRLDRSTLVVHRGAGEPVLPPSFSKWFRRTTQRLGMKGTRLHDVRHAVATELMRRGVHAKVASAVLGHASEAFTLKQYTHLTEDLTALGADALDAAWQASSDG